MNTMTKLQPSQAACFPDFVIYTEADIEIINGQVSFAIASKFDQQCFVSALIPATEKRIEEYVPVDGNPENDRPTSFFALEVKLASWSDPAVGIAIVTDSEGVAVVENMPFMLTNDQCSRLNELLHEMARDAHFKQLEESALCV